MSGVPLLCLCFLSLNVFLSKAFCKLSIKNHLLPMLSGIASHFQRNNLLYCTTPRINVNSFTRNKTFWICHDLRSSLKLKVERKAWFCVQKTYNKVSKYSFQNIIQYDLGDLSTIDLAIKMRLCFLLILIKIFRCSSHFLRHLLITEIIPVDISSPTILIFENIFCYI